MDVQPTITVIIPARNEEQYIAGALGGLRSQDYPDVFEVIVVDNASTDRTAEEARRFGVKVMEEKRAGVQFARERGRKEARGGIAAYLDADCIPPPDWLRKGMSAFSNPQVVGVSGPYDYYDGKRIFRLLSMLVERSVFRFIHFLVHEVLHAGGVILGGNAFLRAGAMEKIGGFDTSIAFYGDDTDTARRLAKTGRLVFKRNLIVKSSVRRFQKQSYLKVNLRYFSNFLTVLLFKRPVSQ